MKNVDFDCFKDFLVKEPNDSLRELEEAERGSGFPIIGRGVQDLLRLIMTTAKPEYILELGTGVGFSSIFMASCGDNIKNITTIEIKESNLKRAVKNIESYGYSDRISCIHGDAVRILRSGKDLKDLYDFIFIDCAKAQYVKLWQDIRAKIRPGGIVLTDNVLQKGSVIKSRFLLNRRDRTIHKRMREFLYNQLNDEEFTGAIFEIDDGVTILTRNEKT